MAKASNPRATPMMQQYYKIKEKHPGVILFYRMGDFYEMFDDDAVEASKILGITLTSRSKGADAVPMAGVPVHALKDYLKKLTNIGRRVAICEQLEEATKGKKLVERGVVRIITPGTLTDNIEDDTSSYLMSIVTGTDGIIYLAWGDLSTGYIALKECRDQDITEVVVGLNIAETIYPEGRELPGDGWPNPLLRPGWQFHAKEGKGLYDEIYGTGQTHLMGELSNGLWSTLAGLLAFMKETQMESLGHLKIPDIQEDQNYLKMDTNTVSSLDLVLNHRSHEKAYTLFWTLDKCHTAGGRRLLQQWITKPLYGSSDIRLRQDVFECLIQTPQDTHDCHGTLQHVYDMERLLTRLSLNRGGPRDIASLGKSLDSLQLIQNQWNDAWNSEELLRLQKLCEPIPELTEKIKKYLNDELPMSLGEGNVIAEGVDDTLDELRAARSQAHQWLAEYQAKEVEATGLSKLRVIHNRVFGYSIELSRKDAEKVPDYFKRHQTLKNVERYVTVELKEFEAKILTAREKSIAREKEIYDELLKGILDQLSFIQEKSKALSEMDVYLGLARVSLDSNYILPTLKMGSELHIKEGRHCVVEKTIESHSFIANDVELNQDKSLLLITGPNMAGKSTYIRQIALIVIMAQMGMPVPCKSMTWSPVDRLYTRIGAADELAKGQSTFMVEMSECAHILRSATSESLLIMDEIGRGTSTLDGLAIAQSIVEHAAVKLGARTLFATHYHELTNLAHDITSISNANVLVKEWGDEIIFLHQVVEGATDRSYGIHVARLAGIPEKILKRADSLLDTIKPENIPVKIEHGAEIQMGLFNAGQSQVLEHLATLDLDAITPLEALKLLNDLKHDLHG